MNKAERKSLLAPISYDVLFNQLEPAFQRHNGHQTLEERTLTEYGSCTDCTNCGEDCHIFPNGSKGPEYSWRFRKNQRYLTRVEKEIPEINEREAETNSIL
jgi:hypothetical protein